MLDIKSVYKFKNKTLQKSCFWKSTDKLKKINWNPSIKMEEAASTSKKHTNKDEKLTKGNNGENSSASNKRIKFPFRLSFFKKWVEKFVTILLLIVNFLFWLN